VVRQANALKKTVMNLHDGGIKVSLFIDAETIQARKACTVGADAIEINTGPYADATEFDRKKKLNRVRAVARFAERHRLQVLAGHGLTYVNVVPIAAVKEIIEVNVGHSLVSRAVLVGIERAVREMRHLLNPS